MAVGWESEETYQPSNQTRHHCSVLMHSSQGDSFSEVMEQNRWKESSEIQKGRSSFMF